MAFDESKDKEVFKAEKDGLLVSIRQYNGGEEKVQIGPRRVDTTEGPKPRKAGRLTLAEFDWACKAVGKFLQGRKKSKSKNA